MVNLLFISIFTDHWLKRGQNWTGITLLAPPSYTSRMTQWPWAGGWEIEWAWLRLPGIGDRSIAPTSRMTQWPWASEWEIEWAWL
jgi:hypothetical protein